MTSDGALESGAILKSEECHTTQMGSNTVLAEHKSATTNNFKRFLRDHGLKIEVAINASGGGYSAYVKGARVQTPTTQALE